MTKDICTNLEPLIEDECKAVLEYSEVLKTMDEEYKGDIVEIINDETDHFLKLSKIKKEMECPEIETGGISGYKKLDRKFEILAMKNMEIEDIIKLYREGYRA